MRQEGPEKGNVFEITAESRRGVDGVPGEEVDKRQRKLEGQVLPIQRVEEACSVDLFKTRRRWAREWRSEPEKVLQEIIEIAKRAPGAIVPLLGFCPMNKEGDYADMERRGEDIYRILVSNHADHPATQKIMSSTAYPDELRALQKEIAQAIFAWEDLMGEEQEEIMRARQRELQGMYDAESEAEKARGTKKAA